MSETPGARRPLRVAYMGCVEFSHAVLERVLQLPEAEVVGVVTRAASRFNADFRSLEDLAAKADCPCLIAKKNDQEAIADFLRQVQCDVLYCFGWSYLLRSEVLSIPPLGVVGYHPAALPANRGRHPLIWALVLGLPETACTFFFMDEGADTGAILSQQSVPIGPDDDAAALYSRLVATAREQVTTFTAELAAGTQQPITQPAEGNFWRKRGPADGAIDWRMPARGIHNLVRALARPYVGAHCSYGEGEAKVWKSAVFEGEVPLNLEPGRVLAVEPGGELLIRCGEGAVRLLEHGLDPLPAQGACL
ncbi:MAG: formyltransferase family protein [Acidobacteriota bacterium]